MGDSNLQDELVRGCDAGWLGNGLLYFLLLMPLEAVYGSLGFAAFGIQKRLAG